MFKFLADSIISFADLLGLNDPQKVLLTGLTILLETLLLYWLVARQWRSAFTYSFLMNGSSAVLATVFWVVFAPLFFSVNEYVMRGYSNRVPIEFILDAFIASLLLSLLIEGFILFFGGWKSGYTPKARA